jgi:hypothetical protein
MSAVVSNELSAPPPIQRCVEQRAGQQLTVFVPLGDVLNWHSVCTDGEALLGPPPWRLGPAVTAAAYRRAVQAQLKDWRSRVGDRWIAYVPAHQGYIVATVCRALYALTTGEQTTKENAVAWGIERFPEWSSFIDEAFSWYRADPAGPHQNTMRFVDYAVTEADRLQS